MFIRIALFVLLYSVGQAQVEQFNEADIMKWAMIARHVPNHAEFDLTPKQYHRIKAADIEFHNSVIGPALQGVTPQQKSDKCKEYLTNVFDTLDLKQQKRLRQIMFQVWMNRDELEVALEAFVPEGIDDLEEKLAKLNTEVNETRQRAIEELDTREYSDIVGRSQKDKDSLLDCLGRRWQRQRAWLEHELGKERADDLLGNPFPITYHFVIQGDVEPYRTRTSNGQSPFGGQLFSPARPGSIAFGSHHRVKHLDVQGFDPATGKLRADPKTKPPVEIPSGLTLDVAKQQLREIEREYYDLIVGIGQELEELKTNGGGSLMKKINAADKTAKLFHLKVEAARRIVEELGGDPDRRVNEIVAASRTFAPGFVGCSSSRFLAHIKATAKQCDAFDKLAEKHRVDFERFRNYWRPVEKEHAAAATHAEMMKYFGEIHEILSPKQTARFQQLLFRHYWFSRRCEQAFDLTTIELTDEQRQLVTKLSKRLDGAPGSKKAKNVPGMRFIQALKIRDVSYMSLRFEPLVPVADEFNRMLEEIVGRERATKLLGDPYLSNRDWKRPVEIPPAGMTLAQAKEKLKALGEQFKKKKTAEIMKMRAVADKRRDERIRLTELQRQGADVIVPKLKPQIVTYSDEAEKEFLKLQHEADKMKRIIEQLEEAEK